jgi:hypothetical protein
MPRAHLPTATAAATLQCFKPGQHVAMNGAQLAFAESDLAATAGAYDPALHEAPLVVGHPQLDGPAYGWVSKLAFAGGALEATPTQVDPAFAELVNTGAYKKMSAAFWAPNAPGNPVPGVYYLRHVGFLGATAPAVKGLRTPAFAGTEEGVVEFSEWDDTTNASLWRSLREWLLAKFSADDADRATPGYLISGLEAGAAEELARERLEAGRTNPFPPAAFAQPQQEQLVNLAEKAALEAENAALKKQLADAATANRQARLDAAHAEATAFADGLVAAGRWPQGRAGLVVAVMDTIAAQAETAGAAVQFAQGDNTQAPLLPALRQALGELPLLVPGGAGNALATKERAADGASNAVAFAAPAGSTVDPDRLALHNKALTHMAAHAGCDYSAAVRAVS